MTVSDIVDELRAARPRAGDALRLQVLTLAAAPAPPETLSVLGRLAVRRRIVLAVPAAAGLAVAAAVAVGVTRPDPVARQAGADERTALESAQPPVSSATESGRQATADSAITAGPAAQAPPGTTTGRAQRYVASLTLSVEDNDALSDATQRALAIARDLGGFVGSVQYATGSDGAASVTLRVPAAKAGDAVARLSALGTIVAQNVRIDDLQEALDQAARTVEQLRIQIARLSEQLRGSLDAATRARLQEQRAQAQTQLRELRASKTAIAAEARLATIQLELRTDDDGGAAAPGSRLDRGLDKALAVLAWEAIVALAIAVAALPLVLLGAAAWATRRMSRRRSEARLLGAS